VEWLRLAKFYLLNSEFFPSSVKDGIEEKLDKIIKEKEWKWNFEIKEDGIYGIEITALAKSWRQNLFFSNFFKDDDLTVKIDDLEFSKKFSKKGLFDNEIAWNGNNLKGLKKTNLFLIKLNQGNHILTFLADQTPKIEIIRIYKIDEEEIVCLPKDNFPPEDGNQRQWLTIIFCNLGVKFLKIKASAKLGKKFLFFKKDDSNLKLIINGKIQKNQEPKSHKHWFWCGRTLNGNSKVFEKEFNLESDLHYLEFWVDRNPEVEEIKISLEKISFLSKAKVVWEEINLREKPNSYSKSLAILKKDEIVEILEKAIEGEAPLKKEGIYTNIWYKVKLNFKEGYIFSMVLEIEEETEKIKEIIRGVAEKLNIDPNLMTRIAEKESKFFPYAVSESNAKGIFQLTPITIKQIKKGKGIYGYPLENPFNIEQNIQGGIRYFKWLYEVYYYYKDEFQRLEKTLIGWNWKLKHTPKGERIDWLKIPDDVREFVEEVLERKQKGKSKIKLILGIGGILMVLLISFIFKDVLFKRQQIIKEEFKRENLDQTKIELFSDLNSDGKREKLFFEEIQPEKETLVLREVNIYLQKNGENKLLLKNLDGQLEKVKIIDLNQDGKKEIIITVASSNRVLTQVYTFENNQLKLIPIIPKDPAQGFFSRHEIKIIDLEGDGIKEIFVPQDWFFTKECQGHGEIYKYYNSEFVKFLEVKESQNWCENFKG
ncbi:transglycosylase SLT domain-containing protein, partial [Candidatus Kuenenbacteria bacterium]|nr:transglycosylase SLT domain-containing protein [Candidatus Kuenenbacteria bacterium]